MSTMLSSRLRHRPEFSLSLRIWMHVQAERGKASIMLVRHTKMWLLAHLLSVFALHLVICCLLKDHPASLKWCICVCRACRDKPYTKFDYLCASMFRSPFFTHDSVPSPRLRALSCMLVQALLSQNLQLLVQIQRIV